MTTKIVGLKDFRQNLSTYTKDILVKDMRLIILNKNKPILEVNAIKDSDFILENLVKETALARDGFKKGKFYTLEEARKKLKL